MPHDVVVIGAGHNGLICAAYLARAGLDVVVLEARANVGGCAATVAALGARVNVCNCDHTLVRSTPIPDELELERHGLRYLEADPGQLALAWSGHPPWFLFRDSERTLDSLRVSAPHEVDSFRRYLRVAVPAARLVIELANDVPTPGRVGRLLLRRRLEGVRTLLRWSRHSMDEVLRSFFSSEAVLGPAGVTGPAVAGLPPTAPGTGLAALGYALRHLVPPSRPVGGSGGLTDALAAAARASGGVVRVSAPAADVIGERGRVRGVALADGEELAARAVVVACDPRVPGLRWLGPPPVDAVSHQRWRDVRGRDGYQAKLDAVVTVPPRYRGVDTAMTRAAGIDDPLVPTTVVYPAVHELSEAYATMQTGRVAVHPPMLVNVPSVLDPSLRLTTGEHVLSLETLFTPYAIDGGWSGNRAEAQRWLETFAELAEPGFLDGVRRWQVTTPNDYEREYRQPRGQALYYHLPPQAAVLGRKNRDLTRYETPIAGLFLTGVATFPGGGIWGAPGRNAATVVARSLGA